MPVRKSTKKSNHKEENKGQKLKRKVTEALELPKEIVLNVPRLTIIGSGDLVIENYKGVIEYSGERIRVNTTIGFLKIIGNNLKISEITSEDIIINGEISSVEYIK